MVQGEIKATLTQTVQRPVERLDRQVTFQEWLAKLRNNFYAQHSRIIDACNRVE